MKPQYKSLLISTLVILLLIFAVPANAAMDTMHKVFPWNIADFLTHPIVCTVLLIVGLTGLIVGIFSVNGFVIFGSLGIVGFLLYFTGHFLSGPVDSIVLWLIAIGLILLILEIFVSPGFGVLGGCGLLVVLAALILASGNVVAAIWELLIALPASAFFSWQILKRRPVRKVWRKLVLFNKADSASGYDSVDTSLVRFKGCHGVAVTVLRPAGRADINGEKVDVVTRGEYIPCGAAIEVILVEGMRIVVKEILED